MFLTKTGIKSPEEMLNNTVQIKSSKSGASGFT